MATRGDVVDWRLTRLSGRERSQLNGTQRAFARVCLKVGAARQTCDIRVLITESERCRWGASDVDRLTPRNKSRHQLAMQRD